MLALSGFKNDKPVFRPCQATLPVSGVAWASERRRGDQCDTPLLDRAGRKRNAVTLPGRKRTTPPANKGRRSHAEPPTAGEVKRLIDACGTHPAGVRDAAL